MTEYSGIIHGLPEAQYFASASVSSTEARLLLRSAKAYRWARDNPPAVKPSKKFDVGSAIHARVLGTGYDVDVIPENILASNGAASTAAAKEFIAESRAAGRIPMKQAEFDAVSGPAESVLSHPLARGLFEQPGDAEVSVFATVEGVPVRARFDFLPDQGTERRVAVDLKTTVDASFRAFERSISSYRYDVQEEWYLTALDAVTGPMPHGLESELAFVAVEKTPPYDLMVHAITPEWKQIARDDASRARRIWAECYSSGKWPGYPQEIQYHAPPTWLVIQSEEDTEEMEVA